MNFLSANIIKLSTVSCVLIGANYQAIGSPIYSNNSIQQVNQDIIEFIVPQSDRSEPTNDTESDGRPPNRVSGADRDNCSGSDLPLTALIPSSSTGLTVSEYPTLWFYIPYHQNNVSTGEFIINDDEGNQVYRGFFELKNTPGVVKIQVPNEMDNRLDVDREYNWFFKLFCNSQDPASYVFVEGNMKRVSMTVNLKNKLESATEKSYMIYARHGIWYDALTSLAEELQIQPNNEVLKHNWRRMLQEAEAEDLAEESIINCCTLN